jgi:hypothetical protein
LPNRIKFGTAGAEAPLQGKIQLAKPRKTRIV